MRVMRRCGWGVLVLAGLLLFGAVGAEGQVLTTGTLAGRVVDESGTPVRQVRVLAAESGSGLIRAGSTDSNGEFRFLFMPTGDYDVTAEQLGYLPKRLVGVPVRPGAELMVTISVRGTDAPAQEIDLEQFVAAAGGAAAVHDQWLSSTVVRAHPARERSLTDLTRLSSTWDDGLGTEGLPGWLSSVRYDGVELPDRGPFADNDGPRVPLVSIRTAELLTSALDVVWAGAAGGILSGHAQRGAQDMQVDARATWFGDALPASSIEVESGGFTDVRGEAAARGPLFSENGAFALGVDVRSVATPVTAVWEPGPASDALVDFASTSGADLTGYPQTAVREGDAVNAFGALDLTISERHAFGARVLVSTAGETAAPASGLLGSDATDIVGAAHVRSRFSSTRWNQLQIGFASSSFDRDPIALAPLTLVTEGLATARAGGPLSAEQSVIDAYDAFGLRIGEHELKFGAGLRVGTYSYGGLQPVSEEYLFGGLGELAAQTGVLVRTETGGIGAEWTSAEYSLFAQDRWRVLPDVELLVGARLDSETLPRDEVDLDAEWLRLTGVPNYMVDEPGLRISPRAGVTWAPDGGRIWMIELGGGIFYDRFDPLLLAEWQSDDGSERVRRAVGNVVWPPTGTAAGTSAIHLTVLGQDFNAPRTTRMHGAVTRTIGTGTTLQLAASVRRTDNLPRRTDLNLIPETGTRDQYGRPIYGALVQQGGLLAEAPGTSRRFATYDEVAAINGDGESDYWGATVALDQQIGSMAELFARYTFSRTRDNWFGARAGGWHIARPTGLDDGGEWAEGTSDFDVPHRAVAGVVVDAPFGLQVSALYRGQSGLPFTPGFRAGVDADADGESRNDPAFVDPEIAGMSELIGRWSCLSESTGEFAERNSCRTDMVHAIDASLTFRLFTTAGLSTSLVVDAFDLLDTERSVPDAALYLVDPAGALNDDGAGTVTVPLIVNPDFGEPMAYSHGGRRMRIGISLNW